MPSTEIDQVIARFGPSAVLAAVAAHLSQPHASEPEKWLSQRDSPLGPRIHAGLCRRLIDQGDPRAGRAGRRWLVRVDAVQEEVARRGAVRAREIEKSNKGLSLADQLGFQED